MFIEANLAKFNFSTPKRLKWRRLISPFVFFLRQIFKNDVEKRTIERTLKELQDSEKIQQVGNGRSTKYMKL